MHRSRLHPTPHQARDATAGSQSSLWMSLPVLAAAWLLLSAVLAALALPSPARAQPGVDPRIETGSNDRVDMFFRSGCVIKFDKHNRITGQHPSCQRREVDHGVWLVTQYRRDPSIAQPSPTPQPMPAPGVVSTAPDPQLVPKHNSAVDVVYRNGCVVRYDRANRVTGYHPSCQQRELDFATSLVLQYRRDPSLAQPVPVPVPPVATPNTPDPQLVAHRDDAVNVVYRSGCVIKYDKANRITGQHPSCLRGEVDLGTRLVAQYRRDGNAARPGTVVPLPSSPQVTQPAGPPGSPGGTLVVDASGSSEVRFDNGCTVRFSAIGVRDPNSPRCSAQQIARAENVAAVDRIQRETAKQVGSGS